MNAGDPTEDPDHHITHDDRDRSNVIGRQSVTFSVAFHPGQMFWKHDSFIKQMAITSPLYILYNLSRIYIVVNGLCV